MALATLPLGDLTFVSDDPFCGLEPAGANPAVRSFSLAEQRLYCSKMFRTLGPRESEAAALRVGAWLAEGEYGGLIMDYRGAVIEADSAASAALADAAAAAFPRGILVGFIGDGESAPYTRLMTTLLRDRGVKAARAADFDSLYAALVRRLNSPAG
ncbi:MAG: hypothetical protein RKE49_01300 [Oceanicaulis sp.]